MKILFGENYGSESDPPVIKFARDIAYICHCNEKNDVTLECKHLLCMGCLAQIITNYAFGYSKKNYKIKHIMIKCPKCLSSFRIGELLFVIGRESNTVM